MRPFSVSRRRKVITDINAVVKNKIVEIELTCAKDMNPEIELWNLDRRKGLFEEVFDKKIVVKY